MRAPGGRRGFFVVLEEVEFGWGVACEAAADATGAVGATPAMMGVGADVCGSESSRHRSDLVADNCIRRASSTGLNQECASFCFAVKWDGESEK